MPRRLTYDDRAACNGPAMHAAGRDTSTILLLLVLGIVKF